MDAIKNICNGTDYKCPSLRSNHFQCVFDIERKRIISEAKNDENNVRNVGCYHYR